MSPFDFLLEPLRYEFFWRALMVGVLLGLCCGALGAFVVLRGLAFVGDALAHAVLPGIVVAYLMGLPLALGAFVAALISAWLMSAISRTGQVREDTAIGIVFTGGFALGIVMISRVQGYMRDLMHFLFGNILGLSTADLISAAIMALVVPLCLWLWYRPLLVSSFDPAHARAIGLDLDRLHLGLMALLSLTIVVGVQSVGVVLVASMLITPAASARLLTDRLPVMIALSAAFGALAALLGLYSSFYANFASGGAIVLSSTLIFTFSLIFAPRRGVLARRSAG